MIFSRFCTALKVGWKFENNACGTEDVELVYPSMWGFFSDVSPLCFGRGYDRVRKKSKYVITNYKITCNVNKNNNDCIEHVYSRTLITHATGIGKSTSCPPHQRTQTTELHLVSHFYQNWCQADHWLWYSNIHFYSQ